MSRPGLGLITRYLIFSWVRALAVVLAVLLAMIWLLDSLELLRRFGGRDLGVGESFGLGLLKLPEVGLRLIPFGILFSALFVFWRLTRTQELIVIRAVGVSAWRFAGPIAIAAGLLGLMQLAVISPAGASMLRRYKQIEAQLTDGPGSSLLALHGFYLTERTPQGFAVLSAERFDQDAATLTNAVVNFFLDDGTPTGHRWDAPTARLQADGWLLEPVTYGRPDAPPQSHPAAKLPSRTTIAQITDVLTDPGTIGFWEILGRIDRLEAANLPTARLQLAWQGQLALPILYAATVLLAAGFTMRSPRQSRPLRLVVLGLVTCFGLYFLDDFAKTLGLAGTLPVVMAAWSPAVIALSLGLTILLYSEDG